MAKKATRESYGAALVTGHIWPGGGRRGGTN